MTQLIVEQQASDGVDVVVLTGRLDAAVSLDLRDQLDQLINDGHTRLAADLSGVSFVDSTGLSMLITTLKRATAAGGDFVLFELTPAVRSIVELTRLDRVFRLCECREEALEQVRTLA